jgi:hypothetical protein
MRVIRSGISTLNFEHPLSDNVVDCAGLHGRQIIATESVVCNKGELTSGVDFHFTPVY